MFKSINSIRINASIIFGISVLLSSCGGGGSSDPASAAPTDPSTNPPTTPTNPPPTNPGGTPNNAGKTVIKSTSYQITLNRLSNLNYSPSSDSYQIDNTSRTVIGARNGIIRSDKQFEGKSIYEITTIE